MAVSSLLLPFIITVVAVLARAGRENCSEYPGIAIRFPFRLKERHPNNCGYPGFDLSCTSENQIALELPNIPVKLHVSYIDYIRRRIQVYVPENHGFQTKQDLENLFNLSNSPFTYGLSRCTLMNCTAKILHNICSSSCEILSTTTDLPHNGSFCAISSDHHIENYPGLTSCIKVCDLNVPEDVSYMSDSQLSFSLRWTKYDAERETKCFHEKGAWTKVTAGLIVGSLVVVLIFLATFYTHTTKKKDRENQLRIKKFLEDYIALQPARYSYADIKKITNHFKEKLGQGSHGTVFKGKIFNEILVAVKILNNTEGNGEEFINEVKTMGHIHHFNVTRLVGYCADGFRRALIYEFLPNDSLEKYISQAATRYLLSWEKLRDIALGIAKGIEYLHQGCDQRILHFDIKPHNILLDHNFSPKISDFGLAKLCSKDQSTVPMSTARGTMGYIAPEMFSRNFGNVSYKSDVYSFGMLLLEMVGGRKVNNANGKENGTSHEVYYPEWIYNLLEEGEDLRIQIEDEEDAKIAKKLAIVGLWCIQWHPVGRPTMKVVVQMLEGEEELSMPPNPFASTGPSKKNTKMTARRKHLELEAIVE